MMCVSRATHLVGGDPMCLEHALKEARRLGMSDDELYEYLKVTWLDEDEVQRLARNIGVDPTSKTDPTA